MITEFLLARIAEDEQTARRAALHLERNPSRLYEGTPPEWVAHVRGVGSPERVARECAAKRQIIARHPAATYADEPDLEYCRVCQEMLGGDGNMPCPTLRALGTPYYDHPDFDRAWR